MAIEFYVQQNAIRGRFDFNVVERRHDFSAAAVALPLTMHPMTEGVYDGPSDPCFRLLPGEVQGLMDELWRAGFRPSEGSGSAGALKQAEHHIASLQKIAYALVEKT